MHPDKARLAFYLVSLCGQQGSCLESRELFDCRPVKLFEDKEQAFIYQQYYCEQWHLPDCPMQPHPIQLEVVPEALKSEVDLPQPDNWPLDDWGHPIIPSTSL